MLISGNYIEEKKLYVDIKNEDIFKSLIEMCGVPTNAYIKNGEIITAEDISYHGSPCYEYTKYDVEPKVFEMFEKIMELKKIMIELELIHHYNF